MQKWWLIPKRKSLIWQKIKNLVTKIGSTEFKQHSDQTFFAKKASDWFYIKFSPQMNNFCEQNLAAENTKWGGWALFIRGKRKDSVPLKNLKLICVNLFEFYFLQTFQVQKLKSMKLWNTKIWKTFQDFHLPKESFLKPTYSTGERLGENLFER